KAEKSRCSPAPPRPLGAARNLDQKMRISAKRFQENNRIHSCLKPQCGLRALSKSTGRSSLKDT
ncbi:hypothetical protein, partial [Rhizobium leguminosarum]|uniref:hypothetical protein n=1 Tax=Rhizobium leguminosarum TaxID=384 RepID=UPI001AECC2CA